MMKNTEKIYFYLLIIFFIVYLLLLNFLPSHYNAYLDKYLYFVGFLTFFHSVIGYFLGWNMSLLGFFCSEEEPEFIRGIMVFFSLLLSTIFLFLLF